MKKTLSIMVIAILILSLPMQAYAAYSDSEYVSSYGDSAIWHYGYNSLGTVTVSGLNWRIPYSAYTTALSNYLEVAGVLTLYGSTSHVLATPSGGSFGTASIGATTSFTKSTTYDTVSFAGSHDGYLSDDKIILDWHGSTYTSCDLPSAKSSLSSAEIYDRAKENDLNLASIVKMETALLTYCNMLDWSNFASVVPFLKTNPNVIAGFERLVIYEVYDVYVTVGDTAPSFWFNEDTGSVNILFAKKDGSVVLLSSQLVVDLQCESKALKWSAPILLSSITPGETKLVADVD